MPESAWEALAARMADLRALLGQVASRGPSDDDLRAHLETKYGALHP